MYIAKKNIKIETDSNLSYYKNTHNAMIINF